MGPLRQVQCEAVIKWIDLSLHINSSSKKDTSAADYTVMISNILSNNCSQFVSRSNEFSLAVPEFSSNPRLVTDLSLIPQLCKVSRLVTGQWVCYLRDCCHADQWSSERLKHEWLGLRRKPWTFDDHDGTSIVQVAALLLCRINQNLPHRQRTQHSDSLISIR